MASLDRNEEAVAAADEGLATPQAQQPDYTSVRLELLGARARGLAGLLRYAEAEPVFAQIVDMNKAAFGFESPQSRYWRYQRAQLMDWMGQLEEAHAEIERLLNVPASGGRAPDGVDCGSSRVVEDRESAARYRLVASPEPGQVGCLR
jgi:tetratricopeptide (TPR) repeat protein